MVGKNRRLCSVYICIRCIWTQKAFCDEKCGAGRSREEIKKEKEIEQWEGEGNRGKEASSSFSLREMLRGDKRENDKDKKGERELHMPPFILSIFSCLSTMIIHLMFFLSPIYKYILLFLLLQTLIYHKYRYFQWICIYISSFLLPVSCVQ